MQPKTRYQEMLEAITEIINDQSGDTKTLTLVKQRGYLTGWLARLASQDWLTQQEVLARREQIRRRKDD